MNTALKESTAPVTPADRKLIRTLATRYRDIATLPEQEEKRGMWERFNSLNPDRPMVLCSPEGAWTEIVTENDLQCTHPVLRQWEYRLRVELYAREYICDDFYITPHFNIGWHVDRGNYGVDVPQEHGADRGSYTWEPPLKNLDEDPGKLKFREPSVDRAGTMAEKALAEEILGDLLEVRIKGSFWWSMGLTLEVIKYIGLEGLMMAMYDNPDGLHRLMAWFRDEHMNYITWTEREGLLSLNNGANFIGSGGFGATTELPSAGYDPNGPVRLRDMWGHCESQETVGVSPQMFHEFIFPYQLPLMEQFGLNYYGCCEGVHARLDDILSVPRMRAVSVSPWADEKVMAERLGNRFIYSRKPSPTALCAGFNEEELRKDIRNTLETAKGCVIEFTMKDTHTVQHEPERLGRWVAICRDEIARAGY